MRISVVVPTYNRRTIVSRTLERLFAQHCPSDSYEIIVVVDGSTDGTAEAVRCLSAPCSFRVIEQENRGLAGARNTGLHAAKGDVVLFLDDDMLCDPNLVAEHLAAHSTQEGIAAFGAIFLSDDSPPSLAAQCFQREIGAAHLAPRTPDDTNWLQEDCVFSNSSLRREVLLQLGGFDETFRVREDLEFGARLFPTGVQPVYLAQAIARQYYAKSTEELVRNAEAFAVADLQLAHKHPGLLIEGHVQSMRNTRGGKALLREWAARHIAVADGVLKPICALGEWGIRVPVFRNLGVRALQARRRVHWLHVVRRLEALH